MTEILDVKINAGEPVQVKDYKITPFAQSIKITAPGIAGGFIWNRPVSILVQKTDGEETVIPVTDVTRLAILGMIGAALGVILSGWLVSILTRK